MPVQKPCVGSYVGLIFFLECFMGGGERGGDGHKSHRRSPDCTSAFNKTTGSTVCIILLVNTPFFRVCNRCEDVAGDQSPNVSSRALARCRGGFAAEGKDVKEGAPSWRGPADVQIVTPAAETRPALRRLTVPLSDTQICMRGKQSRKQAPFPLSRMQSSGCLRDPPDPALLSFSPYFCMVC